MFRRIKATRYHIHVCMYMYMYMYMYLSNSIRCKIFEYF
jgi:hypothetical protein